MSVKTDPASAEIRFRRGFHTAIFDPGFLRPSRRASQPVSSVQSVLSGQPSHPAFPAVPVRPVSPPPSAIAGRPAVPGTGRCACEPGRPGLFPPPRGVPPSFGAFALAVYPFLELQPFHRAYYRVLEALPPGASGV